MTATAAVAEVTAVPVAARSDRLSVRAVLSGAIVVSLARPVMWLLGLVGFLAGGGLAIVAWPILVLPTPTGLQNALGGPVSTLVFGAASPRLLLLIVGAGGAAIVLLLAGILAGAWAERQAIDVTLEAAAEEGLEAAGSTAGGAPGTGRVAILRLLSLGPMAVVASLAWQGVYDAAYRELVLPDDLVTPLPIRVLADVPWLVAGLVLAFFVADAAGSLGVRRLVQERRPVLEAWLLGWVDVVRRPVRVAAVAAFGIFVLAVPLVPSVAAAAIGWDRVRDLLASDTAPWLAAAAVMTWVAVWLAGLVLVGVAAAARAAAWTLELPRPTPSRHPDGMPGVPLAPPDPAGAPATLPDAVPLPGPTSIR